MKKRDITLKAISSFSLKGLRNAILDFEISDDQLMLLEKDGFDELVLSFRNETGQSIRMPYIILGIEIRQVSQRLVPSRRIGIIDINKSNIPPRYTWGEIARRRLR